MRTSEFEEREYEAPLYVQLEHGHRNVWSPGQVLEEHVGFDRALYSVHPAFWRLHGFGTPPLGVVLSGFPFEHWFGPRPVSRPLPDFSLNLFIQAKRPLVGTRALKVLAPFGIKGRYWKFPITPDQQGVLEVLARAVGAQGLVCYACAAFDRVTELYAHSRHGSVVDASTFPGALTLRSHDAWYYNAPGTIGVANPDPERIEELSLAERISRLVSEQPAEARERGFEANLKQLASSISGGLSEATESPNSRMAVYFEALREIDLYLDFVQPLTYVDAIRSYLIVALFAGLFRVQWHVLGGERRA